MSNDFDDHWQIAQIIITIMRSKKLRNEGMKVTHKRISKREQKKKHRFAVKTYSKNSFHSSLFEFILVDCPSTPFQSKPNIFYFRLSFFFFLFIFIR